MGIVPDSLLTIVAPGRSAPIRLRLAGGIDDDALFELCGLNRHARIERAADGELIYMPPTGGETGERSSEINYQLRAWNRTTRLGKVFDSSTGFLLPNGAERAPDAAFVRGERWDALTDEQRRRFPPLCPDLVIELRSPTDRLDELHAKLREYADNGAEAGVLVDRDSRTVWVYRRGGAVERHDAPERVDVGGPTPGFSLELGEIW